MPENPCRVCGDRNLIPFLDLGQQPLCNNFLTTDELADEPLHPLVLHFCPDCSLVQLTQSVPTHDMFSDHPYLTGSTPALVEHFARVARDLENRFLRDGDLVVDIGSNDGSFLRGYASPDLRRLGVEACASIAEMARARGTPTVNAFLDQSTADAIRAEHGLARLVTAAGVWFHLDDLHEATRSVTSLLDAEGVFVVQAMYLGAILRSDAYDSFYHEHLCLYSFMALHRLLSSHGLEVFEVDPDEIHGGSLTVKAGLPGAHPVTRSVSDTLQRERDEGLDRIETYQAFAVRVAEKSRKLRQLLEEAHAAGRRVAAYGAPAKSATLLNYSRIGPALIQQALEVNPLKVGRVTPGTHIPVVDEASMRQGEVDDLVLLSWNFARALEPKMRRLLPDGGRILVPVPEPRWT